LGRKEVRKEGEREGGREGEVVEADTYLQLLDLLLVSGFLGTAERSLSGDALMSSFPAWRTAGALSL
jgi:hypothetical protein